LLKIQKNHDNQTRLFHLRKLSPALTVLAKALCLVSVFVYRKLRVCVRGFSAGKSGVINLQLPLVKPKIENLLSIYYFPLYSNTQPSRIEIIEMSAITFL
jgi:hypothetical protein